MVVGPRNLSSNVLPSSCVYDPPAYSVPLFFSHPFVHFGTLSFFLFLSLVLFIHSILSMDPHVALGISHEFSSFLALAVVGRCVIMLCRVALKKKQMSRLMKL